MKHYIFQYFMKIKALKMKEYTNNKHDQGMNCQRFECGVYAV